MPNGESLARHLLYTKKYLSDLLDIDPHTLNVDYEPETFGHSANVPEILSQGGVKYYYHCRGYDGHNIYQWQAPSGKRIVVYREPVWYNAFIEPEMATLVPEFCDKYGLDTMLKVYGVGDHGGGPTHRDIHRLLDMQQWPIYPNVQFGTYAQFFEQLGQIKDQLPVVNHELNAVFTGCYTSQSRIKMANRRGERNLYAAEAWATIASQVTNYVYPSSSFQKAWQNVLFNQFHDILPGSGVLETREHALGLFQESMAITNSQYKKALINIANQIDTSRWQIGTQQGDNGLEKNLHYIQADIGENISAGAGVGFGDEKYVISHTERGGGLTRIVHVFNPSLFERKAVIRLTVWDWPVNEKDIVIEDEEGKEVPCQCHSSRRKLLHAVSEFEQSNGNPGGKVVSFQLHAQSGKLIYLNERLTKGESPCQVAVHPHSVFLDQAGRFACVPDLGTDRVEVYEIDQTHHKLAPQHSIKVESGSGPRHIAFHPNNSYAYMDRIVAMTVLLYFVLKKVQENYRMNSTCLQKDKPLEILPYHRKAII